MENPSLTQPNLYLAGFMGTGKTALGRKLAEHWRVRFIDADAAIEHAHKKSIPEIFTQEGEEAFRAKERDFLENGHPDYGCVVSLGGGAVCQPGIIELLRKKGVLICLFAGADTIFARTRGCAHRPLLNAPDPLARIQALLKEREPYYRKAGVSVLTDGRTFSDLIAQVERIYRREARKFSPQTKDGAKS